MTQPALFTTPTQAGPAIPTAGHNSWLAAHLIRTGHMTETGATRAARIRTCWTCKAAILVGLDADTCAIETTTDPTPLTPLGEALALLDNRRTWALHRERSRYVLDRRDHHEITHHPATSRSREDVLRAHRCHTPPAADAVTAPSSFTPPTPPLPPGAPAPF